jgi:hypothetical protein
MTATDLVENMHAWNQQEHAGEYSDTQLMKAKLSLGKPAVRFAAWRTNGTQEDKPSRR